MATAYTIPRRDETPCRRFRGSYLYQSPHMSTIGLNSTSREGFMKTMRLLAVGAIVCLAASFAAAEEKKADYAKLAVGKWEVVAAHAGGPPKGGLVEFTK